MRVAIRMTAVCAAMALTTTVSGGPVKPLNALPALEGMPERWSGVMDLFDVPGMAVAVVKDGEIYAQGFGVRDPESGAPVTSETMFYIASATKTYTASGIVALAGDGKLSLDDPVKKHLPRLALPDSSLAERLTVRDLLCHRYGINSPPVSILEAFSGEITDDRYWHWLERGYISGEVDYTNIHFTLAGRVIEAVSGRDWRDFLNDRLFVPAGMERTTGFASAMYADSDHATPMVRLPGGQWGVAEPMKTDRTMHAAGGLGTSAADGARWLLLHLNDGEINGTRILPADLTREMQTVQSELKQPSGSVHPHSGFGMAWFIESFNDRLLLTHGGDYEGARSYLAMLPDDGAAFIVLINSGARGARQLSEIVTVDVLERLTGTKSELDVYERLTARARQAKSDAAAKGPSPSGQPRPGLTGADLSRPIGLYSGWFRNEHLGTIIVTRSDQGLLLAMGDMQLDCRSVEGERDAFLANGQRGSFVVDDHGGVVAVRVVLGPGAPIEFVR